MKGTFSLVVAVWAVLGASVLYAAPNSLISGKITELWVNDRNIQGVFISVGKSYTPSCNASYNATYLLLDPNDSTNPMMKQAYAMALSAFMAGKTVTIEGSGECYPGTSLEKLRYINVIP